MDALGNTMGSKRRKKPGNSTTADPSNMGVGYVLEPACLKDNELDGTHDGGPVVDEPSDDDEVEDEGPKKPRRHNPSTCPCCSGDFKTLSDQRMWEKILCEAGWFRMLLDAKVATACISRVTTICGLGLRH